MNKYINYLRLLVSTFLICWIIFLSLVFYQLGTPTTGLSGWINHLYVNKSQIARSIQTPKLIIVSGSNGLYGISCKAISEETGLACLNGGTQAAMGTDYLFSNVREWAKPQDIILLTLEYQFYREVGIPNDVLIDYVISYDTEYLFSLKPLQQLRFIGGLTFVRLFQGISKKINYSLPAEPPKNPPSDLNEYGDSIKNNEVDITPQFIQTIDELEPFVIQGYIQQTYGMKNIRKFIKWARENHIQVLATWPNTVKFEVYQEPAQQEYFQSIKDFYHEISVPVLGEPEDFMYEKSMFYDTIYHLHDRGVRQRTRQTLDLLLPYLAGPKEIP
ncbi:hypothetical protein [Oscillatoria acuminata]|uniref:SGNH/GDSL hydrolase family protein n=1 Tax=Oscillatoria acuminata PCC 6304 TaxID=56110 RepID=K9TSD0_9CYAN|nr:hypothetical protein [Oscillatoria acuminata]AFY85091.1 hypothetical protein Oscil6304_5612 [Oscillatoria acuminata PCC 6304]